MYDFKTHEELGNPGPAEGNKLASNHSKPAKFKPGSGSWGWTFRDREFIAIGQTNGTAFAEVTSKGQLEYLGRLPAQASPVIWHEMKSMQEYLFVGSEGAGHGVQIFDMKKLLKLSPKNPKTFDPKTDLTAWFNDLTEGAGVVGRSHNVVTNEEKKYAVAVGSGGRAGRNDTCAGGLIFINVDDITKPYKEGKHILNEGFENIN
jgi:hypothetical protein